MSFLRKLPSIDILNNTGSYTLEQLTYLTDNKLITPVNGVIAWGDNSYNVVGAGPLTNVTPRKAHLVLADDIAELFVSNIATTHVYAACYAKMADNTTWTWGNMAFGQLGVSGNGADGPLRPTHVNFAGADSVAQGYATTLMIRNGGELWGIGYNNYGQLGLGNKTNMQSSVVRIGTDSNWAKVYQHDTAGYGIKTDGTLWGWGTRQGYMLGNGISDSVTATPTQIGTATDWADFNCTSITTTTGAMIGIKTDGSMWGWGHNNNHTLGFGTTGAWQVPTLIPAPKPMKQVSIGTYITLAVATDGTLWSWGTPNNPYGSGLSTATNTPSQVGTDTDWKEARSSIQFGGAIKTDGRVYYSGVASMNPLTETLVYPFTLVTQVSPNSSIKVSRNIFYIHIKP